MPDDKQRLEDQLLQELEDLIALKTQKVTVIRNRLSHAEEDKPKRDNNKAEIGEQPELLLPTEKLPAGESLLAIMRTKQQAWWTKQDLEKPFQHIVTTESNSVSNLLWSSLARAVKTKKIEKKRVGGKTRYRLI